MAAICSGVMFEVRARDRRIAWRFAFDANPPTIATGEFAAALVIARRFFLEAKPPTVATGSGEVTTARAPTRGAVAATGAP